MREMRDYQELYDKIGLKKYQKEFLEDESKIVIGNYPRGSGKTFLLVNKVLKNKPKNVLFLSWTKKQGFDIFYDKIKEIENCLKEYVLDIRISKKENKIEINWKDLYRTNIVFESFLSLDRCNNIYYDMILFNDILPQLDLKSNKYISVVTMNCVPNYIHGCRKDISYHTIGIKELLEEKLISEKHIEECKKYKNSFIKELDIHNEYDILFKKESKEFNKLEVINKQIQELYEEYMSIEKTEKTTIRRDKVLMQIRMLEDMKVKYCKVGDVND